MDIPGFLEIRDWSMYLEVVWCPVLLATPAMNANDIRNTFQTLCERKLNRSLAAMTGRRHNNI